MNGNLRKAPPSGISVPERVKRAFLLIVSLGILAKAPEEVLPPLPPPQRHVLDFSSNPPSHTLKGPLAFQAKSLASESKTHRN